MYTVILEVGLEYPGAWECKTLYEVEEKIDALLDNGVDPVCIGVWKGSVEIDWEINRGYVFPGDFEHTIKKLCNDIGRVIERVPDSQDDTIFKDLWRALVSLRQVKKEVQNVGNR